MKMELIASNLLIFATLMLIMYVYFLHSGW